MKFEFPDSASYELREQNALSSEKVAKAMRDGEDVEIKNAVITGDLILNAERVAGRITIQRTTFLGRVDWSHTIFNWIVHLEGCVFEEEAVFASAKFSQDLDFADDDLGGPKFKQGASFNGAQIGSGAFFNSAEFAGEANFLGAHIGDVAFFQGAKFTQRANFNDVNIDKNAFFQSSEFEGEATGPRGDEFEDCALLDNSPVSRHS